MRTSTIGTTITPGGRPALIHVLLAVALMWSGVGTARAQCSLPCPWDEGFDPEAWCDCTLVEVLEQMDACWASANPFVLTPMPPLAELRWIITYYNDHCDEEIDIKHITCEQVQDLIITRYGVTDPAEICAIKRFFGCPATDCDEDHTPPGDPTMPWVVDEVPDGWGDPFKDPPRIGNVELAKGTFTSTEIDLALPSPGFSWVIARANTRNRRDPGNSNKFTLAENNVQGYNWMQLSHPELTVTTGLFGYIRSVTLRYQSDGYLEFMEAGNAVNVFVGYGSNPGGLKFIPGADSTPNLYEYYDQRGTVSTFFDPLDGRSGDAAGRLWKIVDANANTAWVGHPTDPIEAADDGYSAAGMLFAVDPANRRYTNSYSNVGGLTRLTGVVAETKTSGTWEGSPDGLVTVGEVTYTYYSSNEADLGLTGDLKTVEVEQPLTDPAVKDTRTRYYRYYTSTSTAPKTPHMLKLILGAEGTRQYDWTHDSNDHDFDGDFTGETDANLKPYAEQYLNYMGETDIRVKEFFSNGACGCGSQSGGLYTLTFTPNGSFPTSVGYHADVWYSETKVQQPDSTYLTYLIDQSARPMAEIRSSGNPATSIGSYWATRMVRNGMGQTSNLVSPAATTAFDYSTKAFTTSNTSGLVTVFEYCDDWTLEGILRQTKFKEGIGSGQPEKLLSTRLFMAREFGLGGDLTLFDEAAWIFRPFVTSSWDYHQEGTTASTSGSPAAGSHETVTAYVFHSTALTNPQSLAPKTVTVTHPLVSTGNNGSGSATVSSQYLLPDGRVTFSRAPDSIISYTGYDIVTGQPSVSVADADTTEDDTGEVFEGVSIPDDFDSSGSPLHYVMRFTYDPQGRSDTTTIPNGRVMKQAYAALKDRQTVQIGIPRVASATYYGPASYSVSNQNGRSTFQGTIALSSSGTATAPSVWIDETETDIADSFTDPITSLAVGTLARMGTTAYDTAGARALRSRSYFVIPGSDIGTAGTHYDETRYAHDDMARLIRVRAPSSGSHAGTISRTVYDTLGRATEQWVGTDDTGLTGSDLSGTSNMTKVTVTEYDGGSDKGNGYVTKTTQDPDGNWGTTSDQRITQFTNDVRGRAIIVTNPLALHALNLFDNESRLLARGLYSSTSGLTVNSDPTDTTSANRLELHETLYDERGQGWKTIHHKIELSDGDKLDTLIALNWYDPVGRRIKTLGAGGHAKTKFDRLGRVTDEFVLAKDDDGSTYGNVYSSGTTDLAGDTVLKQDVSIYDNEDRTGNLVLSASVARFHDDLLNGTTGPLHSNADSLPYKLEADDVEGRLASLQYRRYDTLDRVIDVAEYGTNGSGNASDLDIRPSGWLTYPTRSDPDVLISTYVYYDNGLLKDVVDPMNRTRRTEFDAAGRVVKEIANYDDGAPSADTDQTIRYEYTDGLRTKYIADLPSSDQETVYTYGTVKSGTAPSAVATGHLLREVAYPDSSGSSDVVTYAYNALGQETYRKDQTATTLEKEYDLAGRMIKDAATPTGSIDGAVKRIEMAYTGRGQFDTVTQYDATTSGSVVDQVKYLYDDWGNVTDFKQDRNSTVAGSGGDEYNVGYSYAKATPSGGRPGVRATGTTLPGSVTVAFNYSSASYSLADVAGRVSSLSMSSTPVATYQYLGAGRLVGTDLPEPAAVSRLYTGTNTYGNLDRFGRITSSRWAVDGGRDFFRVDLAYDRNSNITLQRDLVHRDWSASGDPERFSAKYTMDGLNRLVETKEGNWDGSAIDITSRSQAWTLSQTGDWLENKIDHDGDATLEIDEDSTFNTVNELTGRTVGMTTYTPAYDGAGNLTDDGDNYIYVYDAWGRLVAVKGRGSGNPLVAEYRYNGLGYRIGWHYDTEPDSDVDGSDPWYYSVFDTSWRVVATYRASDTSPKERFVWHNAGSDGSGDASYIDTIVLREKDTTAAWTAATTTATDERINYCQNWRADVVVLISAASGQLIESVKYSSYGVPCRIDPADFNHDGFVDGLDSDTFTNAFEAPSDEADVNFDGFLDGIDSDLFNNWYADPGDAGPYVLSRPELENRIGYAAYHLAPHLAGAKYHARFRLMSSDRGTWSRRDPIGYAADVTLYSYTATNPVFYVDPFGLAPCPGGCKDDKGGGGDKKKDDDKKDTTEKKEGKDKDEDDYHKRLGAYYCYALQCPTGPLSKCGWTRDVKGLMTELASAAARGCCVKSFDLSTHHGPSGTYSCDSDLITDKEFIDSITPCSGADIDLDMCNTCGLARKIRDRFPGVPMRIHCIEGESADDPLRGIDWTWWPEWLWGTDGEHWVVETPPPTHKPPITPVVWPGGGYRGRWSPLE